MKWSDAVLRFWFDELRPADWWSAAAAVDDAVRSRFADLHRTLAPCPPDSTTLDAGGHLAVVIVLDQFSRHLHRGSARAFACDAAALASTIDALDRGLDAQLPSARRHFLYMPLMHSEDPRMQQRSVELFATLDDPRAVRSANEHRDIILRFGRFPSRNAVLGRPSTDDERAYLVERSNALDRRRGERRTT